MTFSWDQCDASYPVRMSLLNHVRFKHGNPEEFTCQHCGYRTTKKENLHQHVRSIHEKIKEICDLCGKIQLEQAHEKGSLWNSAGQERS